MTDSPLNGTKETLFSVFADEIDRFYWAQFRYKTSCAFARFPTVDIKRIPVHLYLRFRPGGFWPDDSVMIAAIEFRNERHGHGTRLLTKLVEMSDRFGVRSIGIEQTGRSESIRNFVRKFGFKNHRDERNWLITVDALKSRLEALPGPRTRRANKNSIKGSRTAESASQSLRAYTDELRSKTV